MGGDTALVATIGSIYVHPEFQHHGVGRSLIKKISRAAKVQGLKGVTLHVLVANERARSFYQYLGWEEDLDPAIEGLDQTTTQKVRYRTNPISTLP